LSSTVDKLQRCGDGYLYEKLMPQTGANSKRSVGEYKRTVGLRDQKGKGVERALCSSFIPLLSFPLREKNVARRERQKEKFKIDRMSLSTPLPF
jgi:hypothetical protein